MARPPKVSWAKRFKNRGTAIAIAAVLTIVILLLAYWLWPRNETEALKQWVEKQNFVLLVPARGEFLPGDIVRWPAASPGAPPSGNVILYQRSAKVLGEPEADTFQKTGPFHVTLIDSIQAGLRAGALSAQVGAEARAKGVQDFELIMRDVVVLEAPLAALRDAVAADPDLAAALRDPNTTIVTRILRPARFEYRFKRQGETGFLASIKRLLGVGGDDPIIESGGSFRSGTTFEADQPMVIGIAMARLDIPEVRNAGSPARLRKLEFKESRALQPDANASLWPAGTTLRVLFQNGSAEQKRLFQQAMSDWLAQTNLGVRYVASESDAEVRVKFAADGSSYSYVGRDASRTSSDQPTIVLGYPVSDPQAKAAYLHEIGHALGLVHEFQNPEAQALYDRDAIFSYFSSRMRWDRQVVEKFFFNANAYPGTRPLDRNSVMGYPLPADVFKSGPGFTPAHELTKSDRAYIRQLYPRQS